MSKLDRSVIGVATLSAMTTYLTPVMPGTVGYAANSLIATLNMVVPFLSIRASLRAQGGVNED